MRLAMTYPGAALAPKMNVRGWMSAAATRPDTICSYSVTMCSTLSICRLYSCRRLTMTSSR